MFLKLISGGQTGADQAALDAAIELGLTHGGWVPQGRWTENGPLAERYEMQESPSADPAVRTEWNVRDSDATLIVSHGALRSGSSFTHWQAARSGKPLLHIDLDRLHLEVAGDVLRGWLAEHNPSVLNVAGPRASTDPAIYAAVKELLIRALAPAAA